MTGPWRECPQNKIADLVQKKFDGRRRKTIVVLSSLSLVASIVFSSMAANMFSVPYSIPEPVKVTCEDAAKMYSDLCSERLSSANRCAVQQHIYRCCKCRKKYLPDGPCFQKAFHRP